MSFGVAYGLALQGVKQARLQTNLLPYEVRLERVIRGKKPWMVAAAAALLFGMCLIAMASGMEKSAVEDPTIKNAGESLERIAKLAKDNENEFNGHLEKMKKSEETLRRIGAGVEERLNWQLLHQYINLCTPQPNGKRLVELAENRVQPYQKYWLGNKKAQTAWQDYQDRQTGKLKDLPLDKAQELDRTIKENLIQVNIIGINALYTDDLYPFYSKILLDGSELPGMQQYEKEKVKAYAEKEDAAARKALSDEDIGKSMTEAKNAPKDGWVVEIRGYTYVQPKSEEFVDATLIENLKYPSKLKDIQMSDALKGKIEKRVGYLHLYKRKPVYDPVPGRFEFVGRSYLSSLVKGNAQGGFGAGPGPGGPMMPMGPRGGEQPGGPVPEGKEKANRDMWRPMGLETAAIVGEAGGPGGGGFAPPPGAVPPPGGVEGAKGKQKAVPRYEFVIVFIWREPIGPEPTAVAAGADKKN